MLAIQVTSLHYKLAKLAVTIIVCVPKLFLNQILNAYNTMQGPALHLNKVPIKELLENNNVPLIALEN